MRPAGQNFSFFIFDVGEALATNFVSDQTARTLLFVHQAHYAKRTP